VRWHWASWCHASMRTSCFAETLLVSSSKFLISGVSLVLRVIDTDIFPKDLYGKQKSVYWTSSLTAILLKISWDLQHLWQYKIALLFLFLTRISLCFPLAIFEERDVGGWI
jgi:hypothetical protein